MFDSIGWGEIIVLALAALFIFGPERLPDLAKDAASGLKRVRAHDGSLHLVCTQEKILKVFRITGLTKVFPIHSTVDEAVAATGGTAG